MARNGWKRSSAGGEAGAAAGHPLGDGGQGCRAVIQAGRTALHEKGKGVQGQACGERRLGLGVCSGGCKLMKEPGYKLAVDPRQVTPVLRVTFLYYKIMRLLRTLPVVQKIFFFNWLAFHTRK